MKKRKTIIFSLSWRDIHSSKAGGAEVHTHEMLKRLDKSKYRVVHMSMRDKGNPAYEKIDGVEYIRSGNPISVIFSSMLFYFRHKNSIDYVIDQCNTHRFFSSLWVPAKKRIFYIHQLTKEIWDINLPFPLNVIGRMSEDLMLRLNRHDPVITVSKETASELRELGYDNKIKIIHNGVSFSPWTHEKWKKKEELPTFIYAGRYSPYKGIDVAVKALARLKKDYPEARLWLLGKKNEKYVEKHLMPICKKYNMTWGDYDKETDSTTIVNKDLSDENLEAKADIVCYGYVSEEDKLDLISRSHVLVFPSIREGWGIPITEAGCVGTASIVFNSPGISEAVNYGKAGYVTDSNTVTGLYKQMKRVIENTSEYEEIRREAYKFSSQFKWEEVGEKLGQFLETLK